MLLSPYGTPHVASPGLTLTPGDPPLPSLVPGLMTVQLLQIYASKTEIRICLLGALIYSRKPQTRGQCPALPQPPAVALGKSPALSGAQLPIGAVGLKSRPGRTGVSEQAPLQGMRCSDPPVHGVCVHPSTDRTGPSAPLSPALNGGGAAERVTMTKPKRGLLFCSCAPQPLCKAGGGPCSPFTLALLCLANSAGPSLRSFPGGSLLG